MLTILLALLIVLALGGGTWLTIAGGVVLADAAFFLTIERIDGAIACVRWAVFAVWAGLILIGLGAVGWARVIL